MGCECLLRAQGRGREGQLKAIFSRGETIKGHFAANEPALLAAWRKRNEVHHTDFLDALEKIVLGPERPLLRVCMLQCLHNP